MTKYRKLPVEVDAIQWTGDNLDEVKAFIAEHTTDDGRGHVHVGGRGVVTALTFDVARGESRATVTDLDWIIAEPRGGGVYPCDVTDFAESYGAAEPDDVDRLLACTELPQWHGADATTMRGVFADLAYRVWTEEEDFSGKRPFGNSGWWSDFLEALVAAGIAEDDEAADELARRAIRRMGGDEA